MKDTRPKIDLSRRFNHYSAAFYGAATVRSGSYSLTPLAETPPSAERPKTDRKAFIEASRRLARTRCRCSNCG